MQYSVAAILTSDLDRVMTPPQICMALWRRFDTATAANAKELIHGLRRNLGPGLGNGKTGAIRNIRTVGYKAVRSLDPNYIPETKAADEVYCIADNRVIINLTRWIVLRDGELLKYIAPAELKLLGHLASKPGSVVPFDELREVIRSPNKPVSYKYIAMIVSRLQAQLGAELGDKHKGAVGLLYHEGCYVAQSLAA